MKAESTVSELPFLVSLFDKVLQFGFVFQNTQLLLNDFQQPVVGLAFKTGILEGRPNMG